MFKNMRIKKRLTTSFIMISAIASIAAVVGCIAMLYIANQYAYALKNYGFSQGDIGKAMVVFADTRSATRAIIGYMDEQVIEREVQNHTKKKEDTLGYLAVMAGTLTSDEEKAAYNKIVAGLDKYWPLEEAVIALGNTTDTAKSREAQQKAADELDPVYNEVYAAMAELMTTNVNKGNELEDGLDLLKIILLFAIIGVIVAAIILSFMLGEKIAKGIAAPLSALSERLKTFAAGNLKDDFPSIDSHDEVADMIKEAGTMAINLEKVVADVGYVLGAMAGGDYAVETRIPNQYLGEFVAIRDTMQDLSDQMNTTLRQIEEASNQVSAGSTNMAEAAQNLAEGATDQAGSVEELQATIANITEGVLKTAENVELSYKQAKEYAAEADRSRVEMNEMVAVMNRINATSMQIGNIIEEIEDIATQTNMLSLNAAIEAARAGEAGRGFAVVADQIGKLADQSAQSAVNTRQLIENSIHETGEGNKTAERVAGSIETVVNGVKNIADASKSLSELSVEQAQAMKQVEQGVGQISEVVQSNSATAEEASATSEELSAQAISLNQLVGQFKLKNV